MIVLVISSGVQNNTLGFDKLGLDFNRVFESSLYRVLVGAWCVEKKMIIERSVIAPPVNPREQTGVDET